MDDEGENCDLCEIRARMVAPGGAVEFLAQMSGAEWAAAPCHYCTEADLLTIACWCDQAAALWLLNRRLPDFDGPGYISVLLRTTSAALAPDAALRVLEILLAVSGNLGPVVAQLARLGLRAGAEPLAARLLAEPGLSLEAAWPDPPPEEVAEDWGHSGFAQLVAAERAARARWSCARTAWVGATVTSGLYRTKPPFGK